jgi:hypothetical protein
VVIVEPGAFLKILHRQDEPLVVRAQGGVLIDANASRKSSRRSHTLGAPWTLRLRRQHVPLDGVLTAEYTNHSRRP